MNTSSDFYIIGGTMPEHAACYVPRQADKDLYHALNKGEFCYVLNSRQMGKSSLVVRAARQLREEGAAVVVIELTSIGMNLSPEQWYDGLMVSLGRQLNLEDELDDFSDDHQHLGPLQRWMEALHQVVLPNCQGSVVIFIDEIDVTRSLPFSTDEFFAAIRQCYNARTEDPEFKRLTFCLIGVATPTDLIQDVRLTPFNIGTRIELDDFTENEAALLAQGLGRDEKQAKALLKRILYWTGGHPYLTQQLCKAIAEGMYIASPASVDRICNEIFLSTRSRESDSNLQFVRDRMLRDKEEDRAALLDSYRQVRERKKIRDDDTNPIIAILRLSGLVRVLENYLWVRNRIYFRAFDKDWIDANMPDAEKRRQKAAYRRGVIRTAIVAAMIIAFICGGIFLYLDGYVWEHVAYYNTYAKRFGVMQGVGKLTPKQVSRRAVSYKFIRKGRYNPVWKVQAVNSLGKLTTEHDVHTYLESPSEKLSEGFKECHWEFVFDSKEKIVYEKSYDIYDQLVYGLVYLPSSHDRKVRVHYIKPDFSSSQRVSGFNLPKTRFSGFGLSNSKFSDPGLSKPKHSIQRDEFVLPDFKDGVSIVEISYDDVGNEKELTFLDMKGKPVLLKDGYHKFTAKYDEKGNQIEKAFFDTEGKPTSHKDGYHKFTAKYDNWGNRIEMAFFDTKSNPTIDETDGTHKITDKYDEQGNRIERAFFDIESKPTSNKDGYHKVVVKYDERGNRIERAFFDIESKPTSNKDGYHKVVVKYDERGNRIEAALFDTEGKPTLTDDKDGFHFHKLTIKYDEQEKSTEVAFFDTEGKPILIEDAWYKVSYKYDEWGNQIEGTLFANEGKLTVKYDEQGNLIEWAGFDTEGKAISIEDSIHKSTYKYDERGNQTEEAYFDIQDNPINQKNNWSFSYHKKTSKYNEQGKLIKEAYFNTQDNYKKSIKYDESGNQTEESYFDVQGNPINYKHLFSGSYHKMISKYNEQGKRIEYAYFDTNDKPINCKDGRFSYHKKTLKYNEQGKPIEVKRYDKKENLIWNEKEYFDESGEPMLHKDGFHRITIEYDEKNDWIEKSKYDEHYNLIECAYFDKMDNPILHKNGYHISIAKYDELRNQIEEAFFDTEINPILQKDCYHKSVAKYDDQGNQIEEAFFDTEGNPILHKNGYHKSIAKYGDWRKQIEEAFFDTDGKPASHKGYHKFVAKYDEQGNKLITKYDRRGNKIEWACFDTENKPINYNYWFVSYHKKTAKYNKQDKIIEETRYDEKNNLTWKAYFDESGKPMLHKDSFHKFTAKYDEHGNKIEENYFDVKGKQLKTEIIVKSVSPDSQEERLGIKPGDIFIQYDGEPISDMYRFIAQRDAEPPDGPAKELQVLRDGKILKFMISPGKIGAVLQNRIRTTATTP